MTLDELKKAWGEYDKSFENKINLDMLKTVSVDRTKTLMRTFKLESVIETGVTSVATYYMIRILLSQWSVWEYCIPALVLSLCGLAIVGWNIYAMSQLGSLRYDAGIAETQRKIERIYVQHRWQNSTLLYFLIPIGGTMFTIMVLKFLNLELSENLNIFIHVVLGGLAVAPFIVWIIKLFPDKEMESAIQFLNEIRAFEKEK